MVDYEYNDGQEQLGVEDVLESVGYAAGFLDGWVAAQTSDPSTNTSPVGSRVIELPAETPHVMSTDDDHNNITNNLNHAFPVDYGTSNKSLSHPEIPAILASGTEWPVVTPQTMTIWQSPESISTSSSDGRSPPYGWSNRAHDVSLSTTISNSTRASSNSNDVFETNTIVFIPVETPLEKAGTRNKRVFPSSQAIEKSVRNVNKRSKQSKKQPSGPGVTKPATRGKAVAQMVWRAYGSERCKPNEESRLRTARTRDVGACDTCRKNKQRCDQSLKDLFVPCDRCVKKPFNLLSMPCCRIEIVDIKLFRLGTTTTPATLQQWMLSKQSPPEGSIVLYNGNSSLGPPRQIYLAQEVNTTTFPVTVTRFHPGPQDTTAYKWTDTAGVKQEYEMPPYYIVDMAETGASMRQYARAVMPELTQKLLVNANPIVRKTFKEAERYYNTSKSNLVAAALMFWSATRMIERFWLICGNDTLGLPPMDENLGFCRRSQFFPSVPVTPVMDTQLDELAIEHVLIPLKTKLLRILKARVLSKKKEFWYEIYLTCFIILHNSERVNEHILDFSRRFGVMPTPKSNDESSLSQAYYHGCKTILAYFHFASGGAAPLSLDWDTPPRDVPDMTPEQIAYMRDIKADVLHQDHQLQIIKTSSMYENEMYWTHQMLSQDWKADMPHAGSLLEFTETDFLVA
ncbi:hypothetical protein GLAREA_06018 [Glarea lozoyensis ATCC 20868]|uniref:Zn(2)-C6 fungal-type domain-containing protein n=1 Tax=Glarea lozoyensis (strain ATCC 20868 / MF5171) TaxID=1116229 RepID=S3DLR9_GLAL2|nr:uncharacterized protein GLAREA_06018 [Glarea lozoyensis ATCC 20868]EPE33006.1 hypothetical protein GLAREA_06018 [Glarea lozoyensis ATCC 20868]